MSRRNQPEDRLIRRPAKNIRARQILALVLHNQTGTNPFSLALTNTTKSMTGVEQLRIDPAVVVERICRALRRQLSSDLGRRGLVLGLSGGVDSSVCAALAVRAVGARRVLALLMPERDSDPESTILARDWADQLGIEAIVENIAPQLTAAGCYARRDEAVRRVVPEYGEGWKCKLALLGAPLSGERLNVTALVVQSPQGHTNAVRLSGDAYRQIVAATSMKQRMRKMLEYYHADRLHYAVLGTPNRLEYDQGFFVKGGDGLADVKPIAHLYKTQVYQLAEYLDVPPVITDRRPTADTFPLAQTQEEFFFSMPLESLDVLLHSIDQGLTPDEVAELLGYDPEQVERAIRSVEQKRRSTRYLHLAPLLCEPEQPLGSVDARE